MMTPESNQIIRQDLLAIATTCLDWTQFANKSIMVSGGSGLLGSYLVKSLLTVNDIHDLHMNVICVARQFESVQKRLTNFLEHPRLSVIVHNISTPLPATFPASDIIIHCASQATPRYYSIDPVGTLMANTMGTMYLLNHAHKHDSSRFLFFSSGEVYGLPLNPNLPVDEYDFGYIDPMQVRSCYSESKRMGETMCTAWAHQYGLHTNVVRPFHTYGPGMAIDDGRVFADFVSDVVYGRDIVLKSDGLAKRPFCYIADATIGFFNVLLKGSSGEAYNVANPSAEVSMRDLAYTLASLFPERGIGVRIEQPPPDSSYLKSPIQQSCPSIEKIKRLGWKPHFGIQEGFGRTIKSYLD